MSYNQKQIQGPDDVIQEKGQFRSVSIPFRKDNISGNLEDWYTYLFDCSKSNACIIKLEQKTIIAGDLEFSFWHQKNFIVKVVDYNEIKTSAVQNSRLQNLNLSKNDFGSSVPDTVVIQISTSDDMPVAVKINGGPIDLSECKQYIEIPKASSLLATDFKVLTEYQDASNVYLTNVFTLKEFNHPCFRFTYFLDQKNQDLFTISLVKKNDESDLVSNQYKLFEFVPRVGLTDVVHFCLQDFILETSVIYKNKIQFLLETRGSLTMPKISKTVTVVALEVDPPLLTEALRFFSDRNIEIYNFSWTRIIGTFINPENDNFIGILIFN